MATFGLQGQLHFAAHYYEKMAKIGQAVQKIWQGKKRYGNLKRKAEDRHKEKVWLTETATFSAHFDEKMVKIGQAIQRYDKGKKRYMET